DLVHPALEIARRGFVQSSLSTSHWMRSPTTPVVPPSSDGSAHGAPFPGAPSCHLAPPIGASAIRPALPEGPRVGTAATLAGRGLTAWRAMARHAPAQRVLRAPSRSRGGDHDPSAKARGALRRGGDGDGVPESDPDAREQAGCRDGSGPATRTVRAQLPLGHRDGAVERLHPAGDPGTLGGWAATGRVHGGRRGM